jgi:hypothetical protein
MEEQVSESSTKEEWEMSEKVDPTEYGLSQRTVLAGINRKHIAILKQRKSRIVMKDGEQILQQAEAIKRKSPGMKISVMTDAPVCSKTLLFLKERGIEFIPLE